MTMTIHDCIVMLGHEANYLAGEIDTYCGDGIPGSFDDFVNEIKERVDYMWTLRSRLTHLCDEQREMFEKEFNK